MGLKVDRVVQGMGTSNTGNVVRRFFNNSEVFEITGVNIDLIRTFSTILSVISCGHEIDFEKFNKYAKETVDIFVYLYNWYRMLLVCTKYLLMVL